METPFVYGKLATLDNFTNREKELQILKNNFKSLVNTTLISPRRWGKTSLINQVSKIIKEEGDKSIIICRLDIFNCRTEEQFYKAYSNAILKSTTSTWEDFAESAKKYLGKFVPKVTFSDKAHNYELSFSVELKETQLSYDEILDLPQQIALDKGKKIVVCIDEFQNINGYADSLSFQRKLRAHWQLHTHVCYCLYGSKRHLLMNIFNSYEMPFYKFGDILFLQKIAREDWVKFISERFSATGKTISDILCGQIADTMQNHPYYVQQFSQQVWFRTEKECSETILEEALNGLIEQLDLLFTNILDSLNARQISFLSAIANGETNFSSKEVLRKYDLGTSANIKNLKKALLEKDLIDILPKNKIELQDAVFLLWLKKIYLA